MFLSLLLEKKKEEKVRELNCNRKLREFTFWAPADANFHCVFLRKTSQKGAACFCQL